MNGEEKNVPLSQQDTAENKDGAWVGDKKISGFLKIFKTPGKQTALDRLSSDIGASSVGSAFGRNQDIPAPKDIFEKSAPPPIKEAVETVRATVNSLGEETKPETQTPTDESAPKTSESALVQAEREQKNPEPEIEIISAKEEPLGTSGKTGDDVQIRRLRTYKEDVAEALKKEKTTVVKMVLDEERRKEGMAASAAPSSKKNAILAWLSIILLVFGAGTMAAIYVFRKTDEASVNQSGGVKIASLVFAESEKKISITDTPSERLAKLIKLEVLGADLRLDTVENLRFTEAGAVLSQKGEPIETEINAARLWSALSIDLPPVLLRSLSDEFMFGVHAWNGNQAFIILKNNFYENAFAGMLKWEESIAKDLLPIITNRPIEPFYGKPFQDLVIKNRDIRGLTDENGEPVLMYTFVNRETIVIATHKDTLNEVVSRVLKTTATAQ